jgi:PPOX class probable F420-dependent enzyme
VKILKEITPNVQKLFEEKNFASFATVMKDGSPQVTPVWVDYDAGNIIINTAEGRVKHRNVTRNPKVAVSVTDSANPYTMVTVRGTITEQTNRGADEHVDKMAEKYLGVDKYPFRAQGEKRILLRMRPERVFYMSP